MMQSLDVARHATVFHVITKLNFTIGLLCSL